MIHFFRKIRQRLLTQNRFTKYLLYAIGEILLVVIGILIALQVNNWNEERIVAEDTRLLFHEVNKELVQNIKDVDRVLNVHISQDTLFFKVLNKKIGYEDYKEFPIVYFDFPLNLHTADLVDDDYKGFISRKSELTELEDSLLSEIKLLYDEPKSTIDICEKQLFDLSDEFEKLLKEQPGYADFHVKRIATDELIQYCLTDPRYINELVHFHLLKRYHIISLLDFRVKALDIHESISEMLKIERDTFLFKDISEFDHIKGVYEYEDPFYGEVKFEIRGEKEMKANFFVDGSLISEPEIYPYSDYQIIVYHPNGTALFKIEYGDNGTVLGLKQYYDLSEVNGNRAMLKKQ